MRRLLLTGFDPFGGEKVNPSWEIARALDGQVIGDLEVCSRSLPVEWGRALDVLYRHIAEVRPDVVISLGQSGRPEISPERMGINVSDATAPDNAGVVATDLPIVPGGPAAYFSTLPVKAMAAAMREAGIPAHVSNTAGTYLCNHVMYGLLHYFGARGLDVPAGFVHVPTLPEQMAARPRPEGSMALDTMVRAIRVSIGVCAGA
jgi:pyroglutamyl-peptidase